MATSYLGYLNPLSYFTSSTQEKPTSESGEPLPMEECPQEESSPYQPSVEGSSEPIGPALETSGGGLEEVEDGQDPLSIQQSKEDEKVVASGGNLIVTEREMTQEEIDEHFSEESSKGALPPHLNPDNLIRVMVFEETKHFPRPVVFDFCPGQRRMPYGQWWVPEGKTAAECTICEYCYNNKCLGDVVMTPYFHEHFNLSNNYEGNIPYAEMRDSNCNCDCPKSKDHPKPNNLLCPPCYYESLNIFCRPASCGSCKQCKNWTSYIGMHYCPPCSHLIEACHECGETFKEGDVYLEKISLYLDEEIKRNQKYIERDPEMRDYFEERLKRSVERKEQTTTKFAGKSKQEVLAMAVKNYREDPDSS